MNSVQKIIILLILLTGGTLFYFNYLALGKIESSWNPAMTFTEEKGYWEQRFELVGVKNAYEELVETTKKLSAPEQHARAHLFGSAAYAFLGREGISVCDTRLHNGCFHEMVELIIAQYGINILKNMDSLCIYNEKYNRGCEHGIGHGILAYSGYEKNDLETALHICDSINLRKPIGGCYGGVFMEYHRRDSLMSGKNAIRPFSGNFAEPCNDIEKQYKLSCIFSQPYWWKLLFLTHTFSENDAAILGNRCSLIFKENISICFQGIGHAISFDFLNSDIKKIMNLCDASTEDAYLKMTCRIQSLVTRGVLGDGVTSDEILQTCEGLGTEKQICRGRVDALIAELGYSK